MEWFDVMAVDPGHDLFMTCGVIGALILLPIALDIRARRFSLWDLKTFFLIFILLQFCMWPLIMYIPRSDRVFTIPLTFWTSRYDEFIKGQYCVVAGLMAFYAGYYQLPKPYASVARHRWFDRRASIDGRGYVRLFWGSCVVTALAFAAMMASTGGVVYFIQNIDTLRNTAAAGWGVYLLPIQACQVATVLYTAWSMDRRRSLLLPILGLLLQLACGFVVGQRALLFAPLLGILLCYHLHVRPIRVTPKLAVAFLAFVAFNMWYGLFRGGDASLDVVSKLPIDIVMLALFGRFHGGESLSRVIAYSDHEGFNYGLPYLQDYLVQFTPRFLFPEKISITARENVLFFPEIFSGTETGTAVPTLMGELYWGSGLAAIVVGLYVHGRVFRRVEEDVRHRTPIQTTIYWAFFVYALFVNETVTYHFWALSFRLLMLAVIIGLVRKRVPMGTNEGPLSGVA